MKMYSPPLHLKQGLIKMFVKLMNKEGKGFDYLRQKFPRKSEAKIKEGIFVGPHVRQLFQGSDFRNNLNTAERRAWDTFQNICSNIVGSKKSEH
jgi:hypothetical protein